MSDEVRAAERPATFHEVFGNREFRAVFLAFGLSWFGDYLAKAAVTALVYQRTESVALSAATFALSYLPWVVGGPVLSALADRYPYRTVMIVCDVVRMALMALVALPAMPVEGMLVLLFLTSLAAPPSQAAKAAVLPLMLTGDRLVVALAVSSSSGQAMQIGGYLAGAGLAPFFPRLALLINAATFGISALLIRWGVRHRPAPVTNAGRHLVRETAEGFRLVFGTPVLRAIAVMVFGLMLFAVAPEGLAAAWAADLTSDPAKRGISQGIIMAATPVGFILGGLVIGRLVGPTRRQRLVRPFAVLAPLSLAPALLEPPLIGVALMSAVCGFAVAGLMPTANGLFVQALPPGYRARAYGVMQSGVQVLQGVAVLSTGLLADVFTVPSVVGTWSLVGAVAMIVLTIWWPSPQRFAAAIAAVDPGPDPDAAGQPAGAAPVAAESTEAAQARDQARRPTAAL
ncbi:MAG TPA: MFS transporter [Pilimelia sp.]|nr:MFS transporter [Pilimelia sp.]